MRKNVWNNNDMFQFSQLSNALNMNLFRPIILSPNFCQKKGVEELYFPKKRDVMYWLIKS